jgi:hypothetical protein
MGDIKVDIPDITVVIERGTEYLLTTQLNDVYQVSINTGDNYNVIVEQGDEYLSTIQTGDVYQVLVNTGDNYSIVVDEPATIVTNGSGSYITVADYATNALYAYTLVVSGAIAYDTISASNAYFGNLIVSDSISANLFTGSFVGEFIGTSSWANTASYVEYDNVVNKPTLVSSSAQIELSQITGDTFSATHFSFPQDVTINGILVANQLLTSSSVIYSSGSTKFGDSQDDTHQFTGSVIIDGPISADSITGSSLDTNKITLSTQSSINTIISSSIKSGIFNATEIVDPPFPVNSFSGVLVEYVAQRQTAIRAGMLYASWSGSSISYTDVSNADVGETWDLSFNFIKVDNNILLRAYSLGSGSGEWTIQFLFKMFPTLL